MKAKNTGGADFEQAPSGTFPARCIRLIDLGTQKSEYMGETRLRRQIIISWELPTELMTTGDAKGKPFIVSKFYTLSLSEKANLRKDLVSWRGVEFTEDELQGFDMRRLLGAPCMVSVIHNTKKKAEVNTLARLMKGFEMPPAVNPTMFFSFEEYTQASFDALPKGIKAMVQKSQEYASMSGGGSHHGGHGPEPEHAPVDDGFDDEVPF